jgi:hypothetical protein
MINQNDKVLIGQIRTLDISNDENQLIVVAKVNTISQTCEVILLNENIDIATSRDFIDDNNDRKNDFSISIWCDFFGNIDIDKIIKSKVHGNLCQFCISSIIGVSSSPQLAEYSLPFSHSCFKKGDRELHIFDAIWKFRVEEYDKFFLSCNKYLDYQHFISQKEYMNVYKSMYSTTVIKNKNSIDLADIQESLRNNSYARMLVRS